SELPTLVKIDVAPTRFQAAGMRGSDFEKRRSTLGSRRQQWRVFALPGGRRFADHFLEDPRAMALLREAVTEGNLHVRQGVREKKFLCLGNACVELPAMQRKSRGPLERAAQLRLREAGDFGKVSERHRLGQVLSNVLGHSSELPWRQTTNRASR